VDAYSNCKQVELFLNGASLGKQAMKPNSHLTWQVKYSPGTLSAKGFDDAGNVIAETKVETTGDAAQIQLTPDRKTINADGEDVAVFTVSALDAQGRAAPVARNKISFALEGAGKIIGVGNGDPSCHEPDTFISTAPERNVAVDDWRWQLAKFPKNKSTVPEYANDFNDSAWTHFSAKTSGGELTINTENTTAIYRAHFTLTEKDLKGAGAQICFSGCDDEGWYFVNGRFVGESHDWQAKPVFDIKKFIHAGDNVIAVGVNNVSGQGGLNPNVSVKIVGHAPAAPWARSLFNGLAQVIVQSTRDAGEIKLTAAADGLTPATAAVQTQPCMPRPAVP
jgi:beta-galactosidase